jgi:hypothetical protein
MLIYKNLGLTLWHIQGVSWVVDFTLLYFNYFLCLCNSKNSYQHRSYSQLLLCCGCFLILVNALLWIAHHTFCSTLYDMQTWTNNASVTKWSVTEAHFRLISSTWCELFTTKWWGLWLRARFLKSCFKQGQCKLKPVSSMKWNLDVKFIRYCLFVFHFSHIFKKSLPFILSIKRS